MTLIGWIFTDFLIIKMRLLNNWEKSLLRNDPFYLRNRINDPRLNGRAGVFIRPTRVIRLLVFTP